MALQNHLEPLAVCRCLRKNVCLRFSSCLTHHWAEAWCLLLLVGWSYPTVQILQSRQKERERERRGEKESRLNMGRLGSVQRCLNQLADVEHLEYSLPAHIQCSAEATQLEMRHAKCAPVLDHLHDIRAKLGPLYMKSDVLSCC